MDIFLLQSSNVIHAETSDARLDTFGERNCQYVCDILDSV